MDFLIDRNSRSIKSYFKDKIIPLSFYGLGSVKDILSMKRFEIEELSVDMLDEDLIELYYNLQGVPTN